MALMKLAAGIAVGYVLGARAGREKYEQIAATARKVSAHPAVGQAQGKAKELVGVSSSGPAAKPDVDTKPDVAAVPEKPVVTPAVLDEPISTSAALDEPVTTPATTSPSTPRTPRRKPTPATIATPAPPANQPPLS